MGMLSQWESDYYHKKGTGHSCHDHMLGNCMGMMTYMFYLL